MHSKTIGYFYKKVIQDENYTKALNNLNVREICNASSCFFEEPDGWMERWKHNGYFLYNSSDIAHAVIEGLDDKDEYVLYAYKQFPLKIENGCVIEEEIVTESIEPIDKEFRFLGYDVVSKHMSEQFGCSPLSCNDGAKMMKTNDCCLFSSYEEALTGAKEFSSGMWEPGPYYIVEVYRKK